MAIYRWIDNRVRAFQVPASFTRAQAEAFMDSDRSFRDIEIGLSAEGLTVGDQVARPGEWIVILQDRRIRVWPDDEFVRLFQ